MKQNVKFAGIGVEDLGKGQYKYHFNTTSQSADKPLGVWMNLPGSCTFTMVAVPQGSTKVDAAKYLITKHKGFGVPAIVDFLRGYVDRQEKEAAPKKSRGRPKNIQAPSIAPRMVRIENTLANLTKTIAGLQPGHSTKVIEVADKRKNRRKVAA